MKECLGHFFRFFLTLSNLTCDTKKNKHFVQNGQNWFLKNVLPYLYFSTYNYDAGVVNV